MSRVHGKRMMSLCTCLLIVCDLSHGCATPGDFIVHHQQSTDLWACCPDWLCGWASSASARLLL